MDGVGDFGYQDGVGAACKAGAESDPSRVATHDFDDHDAAMRVRGAVQAVDALGCKRHGGVKAKGEGRGFEIVIDGLRNADDA